MSEVADIIQKCAELRGVPNLMNRIISEFEYFVMSVLYGKELKFNEDIQATYYQFVTKYDGDGIEEGLVQAFLFYCEAKYGKEEYELNDKK
ncbi:MAG: hypothetical protein WC877_01160 [Dehalococcoidales bacterium]|jgi:hypothetical protein